MNKIKKICQQIGLVPTKRKGQNFLVNGRVLEKIIEAADLKSDDIVLEIGPGLGILTEALAKKVKKVIAVELDKKLTVFLKEKFEHAHCVRCSPTNYKYGTNLQITNKTAVSPTQKNNNVEIIQGDILKISNNQLSITNYQYKLVANLPYQITGAVLRKFLVEAPKPKLMILMLQKEVVERIMDKNKKTAIISLVVKLFGQPEMAGFVSKNNFWPRPKVDSAILKINLYKENKFGLDTEKEQDFLKVIKTGFAHPRKQMVSNLSKIWPRAIVELALDQADKKPTTRAEDIKIEDWYTIYRYIYEGR